jgi:hypothetical protein
MFTALLSALLMLFSAANHGAAIPVTADCPSDPTLIPPLCI